ncbi:MAG: hypothetical protein Q4C54_08770 [Clostridia bacterium]|nr:hypothetical protein [Clostridia bacterium]
MHQDNNPLLRSLSGIVNDLWGSSEQLKKEYEQAKQAVRDDFAAEAVNAPQTETVPVQAAPSVPDWRTMWQCSDEPVDWTEVYAGTAWPDFAADDASRAFLRRQADAVLNGDINAYLAVLDRFDPLQDVAKLVSDTQITVVDADHLCASCECEKAIAGLSADDARLLLASVAIRMARDVLALLPATDAEVFARVKGEPQLVVTITREEIRKARFALTDPITLIEGCGGSFAL